MKRSVIAIMRYAVTIICIPVLLFSACNSDDAYTTYSRYKASFIYDRVMTTTPLLHALNGPGEFCTIRLTAQKQLIFASLSQTQTENVAAMAAYQRFTCISGFIVGKPNTIEMGYDDMHPICFDLACPNCYHDNNIRRDLALQESGVAYCSRCKRRYNLNNLGIVEGAPAGRPLERYRITYNGSNHMVIKN
ncbi:MAG: hypothetical protein J1F13_04555 [Prevotellaceae bacterium]|nr:hypothetical protein [Prevotellaceae bacterium]